MGVLLLSGITLALASGLLQGILDCRRINLQAGWVMSARWEARVAAELALAHLQHWLGPPGGVTFPSDLPQGGSAWGGSVPWTYQRPGMRDPRLMASFEIELATGEGAGAMPDACLGPPQPLGPGMVVRSAWWISELPWHPTLREADPADPSLSAEALLPSPWDHPGANRALEGPPGLPPLPRLSLQGDGAPRSALPDPPAQLWPTAENLDPMDASGRAPDPVEWAGGILHGGGFPVLTEMQLSLGLFHARSDERHRLRFHCHTEWWNPYPWPLRVAATAENPHPTRAWLLVFRDLPRVEVRNLSVPSTAFTVDLGWLPSLEELPPVLRNEVSGRQVHAWIGIRSGQLSPGEVYWSREPTESQERGLARTLTADRWRWRSPGEPAAASGTIGPEDEIEITVHPGEAELWVVPYRGPLPADQSTASYADAHGRALRVRRAAFTGTRFTLGGEDYSRPTSLSYSESDHLLAFHLRLSEAPTQALPWPVTVDPRWPTIDLALNPVYQSESDWRVAALQGGTFDGLDYFYDLERNSPMGRIPANQVAIWFGQPGSGSPAAARHLVSSPGGALSLGRPGAPANRWLDACLWPDLEGRPNGLLVRSPHFNLNRRGADWVCQWEEAMSRQEGDERSLVWHPLGRDYGYPARRDSTLPRTPVGPEAPSARPALTRMLDLPETFDHLGAALDQVRAEDMQPPVWTVAEWLDRGYLQEAADLSGINQGIPGLSPLRMDADALLISLGAVPCLRGDTFLLQAVAVVQYRESGETVARAQVEMIARRAPEPGNRAGTIPLDLEDEPHLPVPRYHVLHTRWR